MSTNALGANLRPAPDQNLDKIAQAPSGAALTVIGRTADSSWLQVQLADGAIGWVLANIVDVQGDVATLPVKP